ncbi:hypothetical protein GSS87_07910 [Corynebacterium sp. 4HC-13]|uniref:hypothetical protein n=1 Tax=Corynebacterium anserum TaxID=2684406 RepID=UPI00163973CE|nr:hypothetical protein [Corynebacterium anserum]MBC2682319.1 hypothetical protein [Corynebacterium anserum]
MSEKLTVAELLARNGRSTSDGSGNRPRRRRRSLEEGGLSVAELTGNIPVVTREDIEQHKAKKAHAERAGDTSAKATEKSDHKQASEKVSAGQKAEPRASQRSEVRTAQRPEAPKPQRSSSAPRRAATITAASQPSASKSEKPGEKTGVMNVVPEVATAKKPASKGEQKRVKQRPKKEKTFGDVVNKLKGSHKSVDSAEKASPAGKKLSPTKVGAASRVTKPIDATLIPDAKAESDRKILAEKKAAEKKAAEKKAVEKKAAEKKAEEKKSSERHAPKRTDEATQTTKKAERAAHARTSQAPGASEKTAETQKKPAAEQKRPAGVDDGDKPKEFAELEASLADNEVIDYEDDTISMPMMLLQAFLAVVTGIGLFFIFSLLWANLPSVLVLVLALVTTLVLVGVVHVLLRHKDKLLMVLAFIVGLLLTIGPRFVMGI